MFHSNLSDPERQASLVFVTFQIHENGLYYGGNNEMRRLFLEIGATIYPHLKSQET